MTTYSRFHSLANLLHSDDVTKRAQLSNRIKPVRHIFLHIVLLLIIPFFS